jgi:hypothetical protein
MGLVSALNTLNLPWTLMIGLVVVWVLMMTSKLLLLRVSPQQSSGTWLQVTITAMNTLNTPLVAIMVILLGMIFDLASKSFGVNSDAATGIIGAGIGLLTGQATSAAAHALQQLQLQNGNRTQSTEATDTTTIKVGPSSPLVTPVDPAQPK